MNPIGIMQGRLSPPVDGRIQIFPSETWASEFAKAAEAKLYCIEWIYDEETESANPMRTDEGLGRMQRMIDESGVKVVSVCADYYMTSHLLDSAGEASEASVKHLEWLLGRAAALDLRYIVLPFVDASSLKSPKAIDTLVSILKDIAEIAGRAGIELHIESDLRAVDLADLLSRTGHRQVRANYDIGNSASLGHDPNQELPLLAKWLGSVHVKDRILGGTTVPLGTGAADFAACFKEIDKAGFKGPFILQVARDQAGREVESAVLNRQFVEKWLSPRPA
ncbi:MAG TPA: sugar phosphate isomerase/epimerase family protein [Bryobacteraceae bacterium]|nr:sugar phosphate isomerase/epimerase family protein [Bryobacteraceae bacterium]